MNLEAGHCGAFKLVHVFHLDDTPNTLKKSGSVRCDFGTCAICYILFTVMSTARVLGGFWYWQTISSLEHFLCFLFNTCIQIMAALWDSHSKFPEGAWYYSVAPHNWVILGGSWATPFKNCLGVGFERAAGKERGPRQIGLGGSTIHYHHNKLRWNKHNSHLLPLLRSGANALKTSNQE